MISESFHVPVLLNEAIGFLLNDDLKNRIIADGTLGGAGYSELILRRLKGDDMLISIDKDVNSLERARALHGLRSNQIKFVNDNFACIKRILENLNYSYLSGIVLDLGLSSYQLEEEEGFSFMKNTDLDMRAFKQDKEKASDILNTYGKDEMSEMFLKYGEIKNPDRLSKAVISRRKVKKFEKTFDLVDTVTEEYKINRKDRLNFLAKIFQALRIQVNDELANLEKVLIDSLDIMVTGGRMVIVSYHSLEDRIVKNFFRDKAKKFTEGDNPFFQKELKPELKILTKKPVVPAVNEIKLNPRSRSAKLRAAEKL